MQTWEEYTQYFKTVADKSGNPIDAGIFDTVVALNMSGVSTTASCEGHLERALAHPWIDALATNFSEVEALVLLLDAFYMEHATTTLRRLILLTGRGELRLQSQGGEFQRLLVAFRRAEKLQEYQEEMREFTAFLKQRISQM